MTRERDATRRLHWGQLMAIAFCAAVVGAAPHPQSTKMEEILVQDDSGAVDTKVALVTLSKSSSSSEEDSVSSSSEDNVSDDLIFPTHKGQTQKTSQQQLHPTDASASASEELPQATPIDMSAFVALIPASKVQAIVSNYFRHDKEVQRAHTFLSSDFFAEMKDQILQLPEVLAFTRYLNASGLDVLKLAHSVVQATKPPESLLDTTADSELLTPIGNEENSTKELNGLHGLVDSVLDVLPQDQILATFFDKTETDQQFSRLIDSIGTQKFSKILSNLQNSVPIRNLMFELHSNGIYISRIVESLKSYFFLASF